jgi:hypothetical protein
VIISKAGEYDLVTKLKDAVKSRYDGEVKVETKVPSDLSQFDAVMLMESDLDSVEQDRLIAYLKQGGRFYGQAGHFRNFATHHRYYTNQFWDFIGDSAEVVTDQLFTVTDIYGIPRQFTEGFTVRENQMLTGYLSTWHGMKAVLMAGSEAGPHAEISWISADPNIKALLHWPVARDYYEEYVAKVVCDYFGLCTLDVVDGIADAGRISFDPLRSELRFPAGGSIVPIS